MAPKASPSTQKGSLVGIVGDSPDKRQKLGGATVSRTMDLDELQDLVNHPDDDRLYARPQDIQVVLDSLDVIRNIFPIVVAEMTKAIGSDI